MGRTKKRIRLAIPFVLSSALAAGQQPPAPQEPSGFREAVEVRVMDLDVVVTDRQGRPVTDLKREDFTVRLGGKPVAIDYFARVEEGAIHAPDLATASPDQVLAGYRTQDEAYLPRHFLIYVDLGHLEQNRRKRGLEALRDLVARMGPSDRGRVVVFDRRSRVLTDWTDSKEELLSAISRIEEYGAGMSRLNLERQTAHDIEFAGAIVPEHRQETQRQLAGHYAEQSRAEIRQMLSDVRAELPTFAHLVGKKAFLFVSGGFEFQPGAAMVAFASSMAGTAPRARGRFAPRPTFLTVSTPNVSRDLEEIARHANASEITFYTVDARGLDVQGITASQDESLASRSAVSSLALSDSQEGMILLARETGGLALLNTNDLRPGLRQVYQDESVYYSIGVTISRLPASRYEQVRVDVRRPGVTVRTRRGYAIRSEEERGRDLVHAGLKTDVDYGDIRLALRTAPPTPKGRHYLLPITVTVPASQLSFVGQGAARRAATDVYIGAMDDSGRMSDITRQEATFTLPEAQAAAGASVVYTTSLEARKGNHRIVVNLRDRATGKMGTARADVRVE